MLDPIHVFPIPIDDVFEDGVKCHRCSAHLMDEACYDGVENYYCETCMKALIQEIEPEAEQYAQEHCKILVKLPRYDHDLTYRCTSKEYEEGDRESYTPNSYLCHCRHECTNYDELIQPLSRDSVEDKICYSAIHERITDMLEAEILSSDDADADLVLWLASRD